MSGHTPGPWCYENIGEKENCYAVGTAWRMDDDDCKQIGGHINSYDEDGEMVLYTEAVCFVEDGSLSAGGSMHDNARLIAAAPETAAELEREREVNEVLLNALKSADCLESGRCFIESDILDGAIDCAESGHTPPDVAELEKANARIEELVGALNLAFKAACPSCAAGIPISDGDDGIQRNGLYHPDRSVDGYLGGGFHKCKAWEARAALANATPNTATGDEKCSGCCGTGEIDPGSGAACPLCDGSGSATGEKTDG